MSKNYDIMSFDLGRLTLAGWMVFLLSVAVGIGAMIVTGLTLERLYPRPPGAVNDSHGLPSAVVSIAVGLGFFFAAKRVCFLVGLPLIRPNSEPDAPTEPKLQPRLDELLEARRKENRTGPDDSPPPP